MERIINFNGKSALLCAGKHRALLTVNENRLPVELADAINEMGDICVSDVFLDDDCGTGVIRILHDLSPSELLEVICETVSLIFDTNISVSDASSQNAV